MKTKFIILIIGMVLFILGGVVAEDLEQELSELEQELKDAGFEWLKWAGGMVGSGLVGSGLVGDVGSGVGLGEGEEQDSFDLKMEAEDERI